MFSPGEGRWGRPIGRVRGRGLGSSSEFEGCGIRESALWVDVNFVGAADGGGGGVAAILGAGGGGGAVKDFGGCFGCLVGFEAYRLVAREAQCGVLQEKVIARKACSPRRLGAFMVGKIVTAKCTFRR